MNKFETPIYQEYFNCQKKIWDTVTNDIGRVSDQNVNCAVKNDLNNELRYPNGSLVQRIRWMNSAHFSPDE